MELHSERSLRLAALSNAYRHHELSGRTVDTLKSRFLREGTRRALG